MRCINILIVLIVIPEFSIAFDLFGFWRSSSENEVVDHLDIQHDKGEMVFTGVIPSDGSDMKVKMGLFPPMDCTQFWNLFPNENYAGCGFWYGPNLPGFSEGMSYDPKSQFINSCQFDLPVRSFYYPTPGGPKKYIPIAKGIKGQIKFRINVEDKPVEEKQNSTFAQAIRIPLGGGRVGTQVPNFSGAPVNMNNNCSDLVMNKIPNWLPLQGQGSECSFWVGPNVQSLMGIDFCYFPQVKKYLQFSPLESKKISSRVHKEIAQHLLTFISGTLTR